MYRESLFDPQYKRFRNQETKKIFTYVINDSFYSGGVFDVWIEIQQRKLMGLTPTIVSMVGKADCCDDYKAAWGPKDSEAALASRIILW
jgi:hypothetical protein